jgi:putative nucleotidyltransferase with HDIG domain
VLAEEEYLGPQVRALLVQLAEKDGHTEQHSRRVALRAAEIGEHLGFGPGALRELALGGLLHDIGKLSVSRAILQKPARLTDDEYAEVKGHPGSGAELLRELGGFSVSVVGLVTDHHERLDGSGYPDGVEGAALSDGARVLGVCDVYDALTSTRVYREAWTRGDAQRHLKDGSGSQFDDVVVTALEVVLEREQPSAVLDRLRPHPAEARLRRSLRSRGVWRDRYSDVRRAS